MLVEGIYDAINLHDKGLTNAVCCFGTNNINEEKLGLLTLQGVTNIDIFFDGDEAGQKQQKMLKICARKLISLSRNVYLKIQTPEHLYESQVEKLKGDYMANVALIETKPSQN